MTDVSRCDNSFPAAAASCCCGGFRVNLDSLYKMDFSNIGNEDVNQIHLV